MRNRDRPIDETPASTRSRGETLRRLYGYIAGFWQLKVVMLLIVFTTVLDVLSPAIIGAIIDMVKAIATRETVVPGRGIEGFAFSILTPIASWYNAISRSDPAKGTLLIFSVSLVFIAIITGLFTFLQRYTTTIVGQSATYNLRNDMYNSLLEQSFSFYDQQRAGTGCC